MRRRRLWTAFVVSACCGTMALAQTFNFDAINDVSRVGDSGSTTFFDREGRFSITLSQEDSTGTLGTGKDRVVITNTRSGSEIFDGDIADGTAGSFLTANLPALLGMVAPNSNVGMNQAHVFRRQVLTQVRPAGDDPQGGVSAPGFGRLYADVFHNSWEFGGAEGTTIGMNPAIAFGSDVFQATVTVPLALIEPDDAEDSLYSVGVDGAVRFFIAGGRVVVGAHVFFLMQTTEDNPFEDETTTDFVGGGPFVAITIPISEILTISAGAIFEVSEIEDGVSIEEFVPGVNIGVQPAPNLAFNGYLVAHANLEDDVPDNFYFDIGGDVVLLLGESWAISVGLKTAQDLDDTDFTEIFFGSEWRL